MRISRKFENGPETLNVFSTATAEAGLYIMGTLTELIGNARENFRK